MKEKKTNVIIFLNLKKCFKKKQKQQPTINENDPKLQPFTTFEQLPTHTH